MDIKKYLKKMNILYDNGKLNPNSVKLVQKDSECLNLVLSATTALDRYSPLMIERLYCIVNDILDRPSCPTCGQPIPFNRSGSVKYRKSCSRECSIPAMLDKKKLTMIDRYGVEYTNQHPALHQKVKNTNIERYGYENPFRNHDIQAQIKNTNIERYGYENPAQSPSVKSKLSRSNRASARYPSADTYDKINNKEWLIDQHHIQKKSLQQIAFEVGLKDRTSIARQLKKFGIKIERFFQSTGEKEISDFLKTVIPNVVLQDRSVLNGKELDIYLPDHNIAIEYCGLYWHSEVQGKDKWYHYNKWNDCKKAGIRLLTIFEDEWLDKPDIIKNKLLELVKLNATKTTFARKTSVNILKNKQKKEFLDRYHIQGNGPGSLALGLVAENELVAVGVFIQKSNNHWILNRFATSHNVPGGFSKIISYFQSNYKWDIITTFADHRWTNGDIYVNQGWERITSIPPDYSYSPDSRNRYHKFGYRRKFLPNKLKHFDPLLSEKQNCENNNILRIWDCGKTKYALTNKY